MELIARQINKRFGATIALKDAGITLRCGQVHALVGENGAGKSTLFKVISAVHPKDSGEVILDGKEFKPVNLLDSSKNGVALVFQESTVDPYITISENIFIDRLREFKNRLGLIDWKRMKAEAQSILDTMEADISVDDNIWDLDLGQWKIIEIARALSYNPKVLLLDESTAFLNTKEVESFLYVVNKLKSQGLAIGFVSHHINEVFKIADVITVMRDGEVIVEFNIGDVTSDQIEATMVGREIGGTIYPERRAQSARPEVLSLESVSVKNKLDNISFKLYQGEVLGIGGLKGAGGDEILSLLYGDLKPEAGKITLFEKPYIPTSVNDALARKIAMVPGERTLEGLITEFSISDNLIMATMPRKGVFRDKKAEAQITNQYVEKLLIKTKNPALRASSLSGGNMQKVVIGKFLASHPKVFLLNNPTRGIDINARQEIYALIDGLVRQGLSVILLSEDLLELIGMSDRMMIMKDKKISKVFNRDENPQEEDIICYMI